MAPRDLPELTQPRESVAGELDERIRLGEQLLGANVPTLEVLEDLRERFYTWHDVNRELLRRRFTTDAVVNEYTQAVPSVISMDPTPAERVADFREDVRRDLRRLRSIRERLDLYDDATGVGPPPRSRTAAPRTTIFILHGRDEARKQALARFLERATNLRVVILHEEADRGRTIIEKLEDVAAEAAFAVALLTGDDVGRLREAERKEERLRARQNVILEAGYFMATLGRDKVALLYEEGVELPSDMGGLLYTPLDAAGAWKMSLTQELREADVDIDTDALLR